MLDLSQMNSGKFRKNIYNFDIQEAVAEIVNIQMLKAEFCGIHLSIAMKNFPNNSFYVSSDQQRIQQVLLNLLSNGLKFTSSGGFVHVECTFISQQEDLHHNDHIPFFLSSSGHGMV